MSSATTHRPQTVSYAALPKCWRERNVLCHDKTCRVGLINQNVYWGMEWLRLLCKWVQWVLESNWEIGAARRQECAEYHLFGVELTQQQVEATATMCELDAELADLGKQDLLATTPDWCTKIKWRMYENKMAYGWDYFQFLVWKYKFAKPMNDKRKKQARQLEFEFDVQQFDTNAFRQQERRCQGR